MRYLADPAAVKQLRAVSVFSSLHRAPLPADLTLKQSFKCYTQNTLAWPNTQHALCKGIRVCSPSLGPGAEGWGDERRCGAVAHLFPMSSSKQTNLMLLTTEGLGGQRV